MDGKMIRGILLGGLITYLTERGISRLGKDTRKNMAEKAFKVIRKVTKV